MKIVFDKIVSERTIRCDTVSDLTEFIGGYSMDNDRHIGFEMRILNNLIRREIDNSNSQKYVDSLTGSNGWIIGYLAANRDRDVYQRDIEEEFSIRRSTVSKTLQIMEQKGLVRREAVERRCPAEKAGTD